MEKITKSDKFKQLKLIINGSKHNGLSNLLDNQQNNKADLRVEKKQNQTTRSSIKRESTGRFQGIRKFDFKKIQTKSCSEEVIQKHDQKNLPFASQNSTNLTRRKHEADKIIPKKTINEGKFERDSSGFLKPLQPVAKQDVHINLVNAELERFNGLMKILTQSNMFDEVEILYHTDKLSNHCKRTVYNSLIRKNNIAVQPLNSSNMDRVQSWLQSSQFPTEPSTVTNSRMDILDKSSEVLSKMNSNTLNGKHDGQLNSVFLLKDWTLVKGRGESELMVSGTLIDMRSRKILEKNHISSNIVQKKGNNFVTTACCMYQLCGNFMKEDEGVPREIKKYFENGIFPDMWNTIASKWHYLKANSMKLASKRSLEEDTLSINDKVIAKKVKSNYNEIHNAASTEARSKRSALNNSDLNSSVRTRAAVLRDKKSSLKFSY